MRAREVLSADQVRRIRQLRAGGESAVVLGRRFNISPTQVRRICRGDCWADVRPTGFTAEIA